MNFNVTAMNVLVGDSRCNASCPFCIAKMTPEIKRDKHFSINRNHLDAAYKLAMQKGATTLILTSKGEPTLHPNEISGYLGYLKDFPLKELQTNGLFSQVIWDTYLPTWYSLGLTTISLSVVHYQNARNAEIYNKEYPFLTRTIFKLRQMGYTVRLSLVAMKGFIDTAEELTQFIYFAENNEVDQITVTPINAPEGENSPQKQFVEEHRIDENYWNLTTQNVVHTLGGKYVYTLPHGADVFVFPKSGLNICLSRCLTRSVVDDTVRNLIYHPSGRVFLDWNTPGATIL
ncbi:MAG: radical SAM protein [Candidatus Pacearchaeota archaeon]